MSGHNDTPDDRDDLDDARRERSSGIHPPSAGWPEGDMPIRREGEWGQGDRGLPGYEDAGESELSMPVGRPGQTPGVVDVKPNDAPQRIQGGVPTATGDPGAADGANPTLGLSGRTVAGEPGSAHEADAALDVPPDPSRGPSSR